MTSNSSSSQNSLDQRLCRFSSVRARGAHSSSLSSDPDSNARPRRTSLPFLLTGSLTFSPIVVLATTCALLSPLHVRQPDTLAAAALVIMCGLSQRSRASSRSTGRSSRALVCSSFACSRGLAPERVYVRASPCAGDVRRLARGVGSVPMSDVVTTLEARGTPVTLQRGVIETMN